MLIRRTTRSALLLGAGLAALMSSLVWAQSDAPAATAADASPSGTSANSPPLTRGQPNSPAAETKDQLSEIVVTAQKR